MQTICSSGYLVSAADQKVLDNYLLETPKQWAQNALNGMINKAVKNIMRDWLQTYRDNNPGTISADVSVLIPAIIAMQEFKPYNIPSPEAEMPHRTEVADTEVWTGGFSVEDWQWTVLQAYWADPEQTLYDLMNNKIAKRKKAFMKEHTARMIADVSYTTISTDQDAMINLVVAEPGYKTRAEIEAEEQL